MRLGLGAITPSSFKRLGPRDLRGEVNIRVNSNWSSLQVRRNAMAKKNGKKGAALVGPLYASGTTNGPVAGPTGGVSVKDPMGYLSNSGSSAPGGSPSERGHSAPAERETAH